MADSRSGAKNRQEEFKKSSKSVWSCQKNTDGHKGEPSITTLINLMLLKTHTHRETSLITDRDCSNMNSLFSKIKNF